MIFHIDKNDRYKEFQLTLNIGKMDVEFAAETKDEKFPGVIHHLKEGEATVAIKKTFRGMDLLNMIEENDAKLEIILTKTGYEKVIYRINAVEALDL